MIMVEMLEVRTLTEMLWMRIKKRYLLGKHCMEKQVGQEQVQEQAQAQVQEQEQGGMIQW